MTESVNVFKLKITPVPPQTTESIRQEVVPLVEEALRENGQETLLSNGEIQITFGENFPLLTTEQIVLVIIQGATSGAISAIATYVLKKLEERFVVTGTSEVSKEK